MQSHVSYCPQYEKMTSKYMANTVNATFASLSTPPGIYYVCHIITPQYLHICDIFTGSKFVQIHFFHPVWSYNEIVFIWSEAISMLWVRKRDYPEKHCSEYKNVFFVGKIYSQLNPVIYLARFTFSSKP